MEAAATYASRESNDKSAAAAEVPSFFLFEATGDSDAVLEDHSAALDDDDAESCSWDSTDQCLSNYTLDSSTNGDEDEDVIDQECSNDDGYGRVDQEEGDLADDQTWNSEIGRPRMGGHKSSVSVDSTTLNEVEKNRLFWEACLAS